MGFFRGTSYSHQLRHYLPLGGRPGRLHWAEQHTAAWQMALWVELECMGVSYLDHSHTQHKWTRNGEATSGDDHGTRYLERNNVLSNCPHKVVKCITMTICAWLTSTAVQLFPNSCALVVSMLSGVRISFTVFKSKFPQRPLSFPLTHHQHWEELAVVWTSRALSWLAKSTVSKLVLSGGIQGYWAPQNLEKSWSICLITFDRKLLCWRVLLLYWNMRHTCQWGPTWMWMVVLRFHRMVMSSSGKWITVK